jgi:hypothetical protein
MTRTPFYVVAIVRAAIVDNANDWMERQGYGPNNFSRELILIADPDDAAPKGYAAEFPAEPSLRTILANKIATMPNAYIFWSKDRKTARQKALQFITDKGYRVKPRA